MTPIRRYTTLIFAFSAFFALFLFLASFRLGPAFGSVFIHALPVIAWTVPFLISSWASRRNRQKLALLMSAVSFALITLLTVMAYYAVWKFALGPS